MLKIYVGANGDTAKLNGIIRWIRNNTWSVYSRTTHIP